MSKFVRKVLANFGVVLHQRIHVFDCQLVIYGHMNLFEILQGKQRLLILEDLFEKIFVEHGSWRHVELHYIWKLRRTVKTYKLL